MKHTTTLLFIISVLLVSTYACKKDDTQNGITRVDYLGTYIGEDTNSWGSWSSAYFSISESSIGDSYVNVIGLTRNSYDTIVASINGNKLNFSEQTYHIVGTSPGGAHWDYIAAYFGSAELDTSKNEIRFSYTEQQINTDTTFVCEWITVGQKQ